jgi:hypothetical protein
MMQPLGQHEHVARLERENTALRAALKRAQQAEAIERAARRAAEATAAAAWRVGVELRAPRRAE